MSLCVADLPYIVTGVSATFITAALPSLMAVNICNAIKMSQEDEGESNKYWSTAIIFCLLGLIGGFAMFLQVCENCLFDFCQKSAFKTTMFGISVERLASRMRKRFFEVLLRLDIQWFELSYISTGALSCLLSKDGALIKNIAGAKGSALLQGLLGIFFTIIVSLSTNLILGLIAIIVLILGVAAAVFTMIVSRDIDKQVKRFQNCYCLAK